MTENQAMWQYEFVHEMVGAYKRAFSTLRDGGQIVMHWGDDPLDLQGFRKEFCRALDRRINLKVADDKPRGRRDCYLYWLGCIRDQNRLMDIKRRVRVYQFETPEVRARFGHLLAHYED